MKSEFEGFVMPKAKMLPVFLLLDVSGSMSLDNKMYELNRSVKEMIETFKHEQAVQAEIYVSIITFGDNVEIITELKSAFFSLEIFLSLSFTACNELLIVYTYHFHDLFNYSHSFGIIR